MSLSLTIADWMTTAQLIYRLNSIEDYMQYQDQTLELINMILPYDAGIFNLAEQKQGSIITGRLAGFGMSKKDLNKLAGGLNGNTFFKSLLLDPSGAVSRGPNLSQFEEMNLDLEDSTWIPQTEQHALSMVLIHRDILMGYMVLIRGAGEEPFNMRDRCVLDNLKNHVALQLYRLSSSHVDMNRLDNRIFALTQKLNRYGLSKREIEILALIQGGKTDSEICAELFFTTSTFKKHLNHIYGKMDVSNRVMLIKLIDAEIP